MCPSNAQGQVKRNRVRSSGIALTVSAFQQRRDTGTSYEGQGLRPLATPDAVEHVLCKPSKIPASHRHCLLYNSSLPYKM